MNDKYLIINAGSSSLKFSLYEVEEERELINGCFEKIGQQDSFYTLKFNNQEIKKQRYISSHVNAVSLLLNELLDNNIIDAIEDIKGVGHRILHGGEIYTDSVVIDDEVLKNITDLTKLGPLHHPGEIEGIKALQQNLPNAIQVAVFDTSFHQTISKENYMYAVPYSWYQDYGVRKYGFHGTSYNYITNYMKDELNKDDVNLIICHIGSGASISAIKDGKCFDTTMGLTPLDGLMMGTRSGNIDSSIIEYVSKCSNKSLEQITKDLNSKSGLLGIASVNDFRDVEALADEGDANAILAINMFKKSIIKYFAQFYFELNGEIDAIVFTAGIGENAINLRKSIIDEISKTLKIKLDNEKNNSIAKYKNIKSGLITTIDSIIPVYVIPTNEEIMILRDTLDKSKELIESKKLILRR